MSSDEALMLEFQRGSREAFAELFGRYQGPLYGFFRRRLASQERAEDLAQETFLVVIQATSRYEPRSLVRTYLYGIALKLLAEERRRRAKDSPVQETSPEPAKDSASDTVLWVREALEKLDPGEREVLMLREYEQLSYGEIAHVLRIPVNTVRSRLFRARMAMKERLESGSRSRPEARSHDETQGKPAEVEKEDAGERSPATTLRAGKEGISQ
jgi:RNA polymerase sigma-70 factor (ECF subfamily)